jgi:hypothetical protein
MDSNAKTSGFGMQASLQLPALTRLGVCGDEIELLGRQGFIRREQRGSKTVYKLCYRAGGRQRSRYVAREDVAEIAEELAALQAKIRSRRNLAKLTRLAGKRLHKRRTELMPLLAELGYQWHGHVYRRRRMTKLQQLNPGKETKDGSKAD